MRRQNIIDFPTRLTKSPKAPQLASEIEAIQNYRDRANQVPVHPMESETSSLLSKRLLTGPFARNR
jgi:hypothetical protein